GFPLLFFGALDDLPFGLCYRPAPSPGCAICIDPQSAGPQVDPVGDTRHLRVVSLLAISPPVARGVVFLTPLRSPLAGGLVFSAGTVRAAHHPRVLRET